MSGRLQTIGLTLLAVLAAMVGLYAYGRKAGKKAVEIKQLRRETEIVRKSQHVENTIRALPDADVHKRLRNQWSRD